MVQIKSFMTYDDLNSLDIKVNKFLNDKKPYDIKITYKHLITSHDIIVYIIHIEYK